MTPPETSRLDGVLEYFRLCSIVLGSALGIVAPDKCSMGVGGTCLSAEHLARVQPLQVAGGRGLMQLLSG